MPRRSYIERDKAQAEAVKLALQGVGQTAIAERLGVSQSTVCTDLKRARQQWAAAMIGDIETVKANELIRLDHIQAEALAAWERTKITDPNAKLLDVAIKASMRKARLLGLDTDTKRHDPPAPGPNMLELRLERYSAVFSLPILGTSVPVNESPQEGG